MKNIHDSWDFMNPGENEKYEDFKFEEYYQRVFKNEKLRHIPKVIFEQWIYGLHYDYNTLKNYAWINYENIEFNLCEWDFHDLTKVSVIGDFKDYFMIRSSYNDLKHFCCIGEDLDFWKNQGTWRIPPIVLDVESLATKAPESSELKPAYQLVEGHSRLGYLYSMKRISDLNRGKIALKHKIYLMREKDSNKK
jgi:hypothetical protein